MTICVKLIVCKSTEMITCNFLSRSRIWHRNNGGPRGWTCSMLRRKRETILSELAIWIQWGKNKIWEFKENQARVLSLPFLSSLNSETKLTILLSGYVATDLSQLSLQINKQIVQLPPYIPRVLLSNGKKMYCVAFVTFHLSEVGRTWQYEVEHQFCYLVDSWEDFAI